MGSVRAGRTSTKRCQHGHTSQEAKVSVIANNSTITIMNWWSVKCVPNLGCHFFLIFHYLFIIYSPTVTHSPRRSCSRGSEILHGVLSTKDIRISLNKYLGNNMNCRRKNTPHPTVQIAKLLNWKNVSNWNDAICIMKLKNTNN